MDTHISAGPNDAQRSVGLYLRVSGTEQAEEGVSLDAQEAELREWAAANVPDLPIRVYREEGKSAWSGKRRPRYDEMLTDIENGHLEIVAAKLPNRLNRNLKEAIDLRQVCHSQATRIYIRATGWVDTGAFGTFTANMVDGLSELDSALKSESVRGANAYLRSEGFFVGKPPWGLSRPHKSRELVPSADARLVTEGFHMADQRATLSQIVSRLIGHGIEERDTITIQFVSRMLRNKTYAGFVPEDTHGPEPKYRPSEHVAPLVPLDVFERVQRRLDSNKKVGYKGLRYQPFGYLARCGKCGASLRWKETNDHRYFYVQCTKPNPCGLRPIPAQQFEMAVVAYLDTTLSFLDLSLADDSWRSLAATDDQLSEVDAELTAARNAKEQVRMAIREGLLTTDEGKADLRHASATIARLEPEYQRLSRSAADIREELTWLQSALRFQRGDEPGAFFEWWTTTDRDERVRQLDKIVDGIWLEDDGFAFRFKRGLDFAFHVPFKRARHTEKIAAECERLGFPRGPNRPSASRVATQDESEQFAVIPAPGETPLGAESVLNSRSLLRARSAGRSPTPPSATPPEPGSP